MNALGQWLGTAMDILDRTVNQIQGAMDLESSAVEENRTLLKEKMQDQNQLSNSSPS